MTKRTLHLADRQGSDWGQDLLFAGLVRHLGPERVIDFPYHEKHRWKLEFVGDPERDWGRERGMLGWTPWNDQVRRWDEHELRDAILRGEVERVFLDERDETYELYLRLRANFFDIPVVVVAGHDRFWNESPQKVAARYGSKLEAMFLDNWRPEYDNIPRAHVYNWSANFDHYWDQHRDQPKLYDVSFQGYNSHPDRLRFVEHIRKRWGHLRLKIDLETTPDTMRSYVRKADYFRIMAQSRVCLNLRGAAQNGKTLRFYEIPYVGSCMLTQDSGARQIHPMVDGEHCVYFLDEEGMDMAIERLLDEPDYREGIARAGHEHLLRWDTAEARAREMLELLDGRTT